MTKLVKLTDRAVRSTKEDLRDTVVPGLIVRMQGESKVFALVARFPRNPKHPTRRTIARVSEGEFTGLAAARETARKWQALISVGRDPGDERERERRDNARRRADTLTALFETYKLQKLSKQRQGHTVEQAFRDILLPVFGERPIADLQSREVSVALSEIEQHGTDRGLVKLGVRKKLRFPTREGGPAPKQARMLFSYLDGMLRWAAGTNDYGIEFSPLARVSKKERFGTKKHRERVLSDVEIAAAWRAMATLERPYSQLYRLLFLTGLRLGEVLEADWREFDAKLTEWTIPAERMKSGRAHAVPLTPLMREVLREVPRGNRGPFVFSVTGGATPIAFRGRFKECLDAAVLAEMGLPDSALDDPDSLIQRFTNHDLRRTMRTRISKLGVSDAVGEAILAHKKPGVLGTYNAHDYFDERRAAHEMWGGWLVKNAGERKVVRLRKAA